MSQYLCHIKKHSIKKTADIQVNIPTYNSYEVTKKTIITLLKQKNIAFDILVIDGGTKDYLRLKKDFPAINYLLLDSNYGSGGAQRIGGEIALKYGYDYLVFTDNDAFLLNEDGLFKMKQKLDKDPNLVAVTPKHIEFFPKEELDDFYISSSSFHYLFVKTIAFKKIDFHNFYLFLYSDDHSLTLKLSSLNKILVCGDVSYYHPRFSPKVFQNDFNYHYLKGLLMIAFKERHILFQKRVKLFLLFLYKIFQLSLYTLQFFDLSYLKTIELAILGFLRPSLDFSSKVPPNKYILQEYHPTNGKRELKGSVNIFSGKLKFLIMPKKCYTHSNYFKKNIYFKLTKNPRRFK